MALGIMTGAEANARFTHYTELPMLVLSVLFIAVLVTPILDEHLGPGWRHLFVIANIMLWGAFAAEYIIRLVLAPGRRHFVLHNIPDLVVVAVPVLRPLRLVRLARFARFARVGALGIRATSKPRPIDVMIQITGAAAMIVFIGAVGILDAERHATGATIHTFGDALWWAITTITTVGYGDKYPVTADGRVIATVVMLAGIGILASFTALLASWFVRNLGGSSETQSDRIEAQLAEILTRLEHP